MQPEQIDFESTQWIKSPVYRALADMNNNTGQYKQLHTKPKNC